MQTTEPIRCKAGWISDIHLGRRGVHAEDLLEFLRQYEFEVLYIVGDFIDFWALVRSFFWIETFNTVIQKILRMSRKGTRVIYIPGNHDEWVSKLLHLIHDGSEGVPSISFGNISIMLEAVHVTADDRKLLVEHGHAFDNVVRFHKWLAMFGDWCHERAVGLNWWINLFRRWCGCGYWSLSGWLKKNVKKAATFIDGFETAIAEKARKLGYDGVVCGHIHTAAMKAMEKPNERTVMYYNTGDWVDGWTALVEDPDGTMRLIDFNPHEQPDGEPVGELVTV